MSLRLRLRKREAATETAATASVSDIEREVARLRAADRSKA